MQVMGVVVGGKGTTAHKILKSVRYSCIANFKLMVIKHTEESRHSYSLYLYTTGENRIVTERSIFNLKCVFCIQAGEFECH
jgi:hypothetical protein